MMDNYIAEVGPEQFEESSKVIREAFQTVADEFGFTIENNPTNGAFIKAAKLLEEYDKGIRMFGFFQEGRQIGFVALEKKDGGLYYLEKLAVIPQCRHLGFGKILIDYAADFVKQAGGKEISIAIINENDRLKNWYEAYGFVQTGLKRFDHLSFTVCFMALRLC